MERKWKWDSTFIPHTLKHAAAGNQKPYPYTFCLTFKNVESDIRSMSNEYGNVHAGCYCTYIPNSFISESRPKKTPVMKI